MPIKRRQSGVSDSELVALLASFEAGTKVDDKQAVQFLDWDWDQLEWILPDAFDADPAFTRRQVRSILRKALLSCRKAGPLTIERLVVEVLRLAKEKIVHPPERYTLWTKFRAKQMAFNKSFRLKWDDVTIESVNNLPAHLDKKEYFFNGRGDIDPKRPLFYGHLVARCQAREEENAVAKMAGAMELFMAIFNMYEMWGRWSLFGDNRWPEGKLWMGPFQFVFRGKQFLGEDQIWFDPQFDEEVWAMSPMDMRDVLKLMPRTRKALANLSKHPLRRQLIDVLRLMQNAMASRDQSYSLLRYWSALEHLYGEPASRESNYSKIIQRASFAEADKELARWKLRHISRLRNEYVHSRDNQDDLPVMTRYLRMLISRHVNYLLMRPPKIQSHKRWLEIVDLPNDAAALRERKALIDQRLAIMRGETRKRRRKE